MTCNCFVLDLSFTLEWPPYLQKVFILIWSTNDTQWSVSLIYILRLNDRCREEIVWSILQYLGLLHIPNLHQFLFTLRIYSRIERGTRPPSDLSEVGFCVDVCWVGEVGAHWLILSYYNIFFLARFIRQYYTYSKCMENSNHFQIPSNSPSSSYTHLWLSWKGISMFILSKLNTI